MEAVKRLVRLRVDPRKARVRIRRMDGGSWQATIYPLDGSTAAASGLARTPLQAVARALRIAEALRVPGVDLSMGWAFEHPWPEQRP